MPSDEIHLYIDESGSRDPDHVPAENRRDKLDYFAFGGILVKQEDIAAIANAHKEFCAKWDIDYPLHSWAIRGGRDNFGWLKKPENAAEFLPALGDFLLEQPIVGIATVVNRPGYVTRYKDQYRDRLWLMCKTAYTIMIERAAKFARSQNRTLRVFFEGAGETEDNNVVNYTRSLKSEGMPFEGTQAAFTTIMLEKGIIVSHRLT